MDFRSRRRVSLLLVGLVAFLRETESSECTALLQTQSSLGSSQEKLHSAQEYVRQHTAVDGSASQLCGDPGQDQKVASLLKPIREFFKQRNIAVYPFAVTAVGALRYGANAVKSHNMRYVIDDDMDFFLAAETPLSDDSVHRLLNEVASHVPGGGQGDQYIDIGWTHQGLEIATQPLALADDNTIDFFYIRGDQTAVKPSATKFTSFHGVTLNYPADENFLFNGLLAQFWSPEHPIHHAKSMCEFSVPTGIMPYEAAPATTESISLARTCSKLLQDKGFVSLAECPTSQADALLLSKESSLDNASTGEARLPLPSDCESVRTDVVSYPQSISLHVREVMSRNPDAAELLSCAYRREDYAFIGEVFAEALSSPGAKPHIIKGLEGLPRSGAARNLVQHAACGTKDRTKDLQTVKRRFSCHLSAYGIHYIEKGSDLANIVPDALCEHVVLTDGAGRIIEACKDTLRRAMRLHLGPPEPPTLPLGGWSLGKVPTFSAESKKVMVFDLDGNDA